MRDLLSSQRGSASFATVIALVPLIGVVALGAEAGSWYVTRQHAQDAADSAAMAGAMTIAIQNAGDPNITDSQTYDYRGKQFAAQNAFCNSGDTAYPGTNCATSLPSRISRAVQIDQGSFDVATNTWTSSAGGSFVRATVSQQQPAYLAAVLGLSTVNIPARAIAQIWQSPNDICALALANYPSNSAALTLAGSVNFTGNGCAIASDNTVKYASTPTFTGSGWAIKSVNGCVNSGNCNPGVPYNYTMLPATVPPQLKKLDTESFNTRTGNTDPESGRSVSCATLVPPPPAGSNKCYSLVPNGSGAYGNLSVTTGDYVDLAPGTYFFYNATIKINGGTVTCTSCTPWTGTGVGVTLVLLGNSSLSIAGGATVNLSASKTNTTSSDLNGVLIDDQAPNKQKNVVTINGGGKVALAGVTYFPNVDVTWSGTTANANTTCSEVIANSLTMSGGANLSSQNCPPLTVTHTQFVTLVH